MAFAASAAPQFVTLVRHQPLGVDFLPLWTAGRMAWTHPGEVYDFTAVTKAQAWLLPHLVWARPYAYPPTALLIFAPFGMLPFWVALALWVSGSLGLFLAGGARLTQDRLWLSLMLMALSPAVLLSILVGQTVLLVAALVLFATTELERRPRWAGVLFGLAAALKPQVLLLAPVALVTCGALETAASAAVTGLLLAGLSAACFGGHSWTAWVGALPRFEQVVEQTPRLARGVITPYAAVQELGVAPFEATLLRGACALFGVGLVWRAWSRPDSAGRRVAALLGGCLLVTPYAMHYDASVVVPTAVAASTSRAMTAGWTLRFVALVVATEITMPVIGAACLIAFLVLSFLDPAPSAKSPPKHTLTGELA